MTWLSALLLLIIGYLLHLPLEGIDVRLSRRQERELLELKEELTRQQQAKVRLEHSLRFLQHYQLLALHAYEQAVSLN